MLLIKVLTCIQTKNCDSLSLHARWKTRDCMCNVKHYASIQVYGTVNAGVTVEALKVETCIQVCVMLLYSIWLQ